MMQKMKEVKSVQPKLFFLQDKTYESKKRKQKKPLL